MLGQDGEAGRRVLAPAEAQQGESCCYSAMHNASQNIDLIARFVSISPGEEEDEEEEGCKEKEVGKASGLPPTPGGVKGTATQQAEGGARCSLHPSSCQELQWKQV